LAFDGHTAITSINAMVNIDGPAQHFMVIFTCSVPIGKPDLVN